MLLIELLCFFIRDVEAVAGVHLVLGDSRARGLFPGPFRAARPCRGELLRNLPAEGVHRACGDEEVLGQAEAEGCEAVVGLTEARELRAEVVLKGFFILGLLGLLRAVLGRRPVAVLVLGGEHRVIAQLLIGEYQVNLPHRRVRGAQLLLEGGVAVPVEDRPRGNARDVLEDLGLGAVCGARAEARELALPVIVVEAVAVRERDALFEMEAETVP